MVAILEVHRPRADGGAGADAVRAGIKRDRGGGGEQVVGIDRVHELHRPAAPGAGHLDDVVLVITVVHAEGEKFEQLARIVFVGNAVAARCY